MIEIQRLLGMAKYGHTKTHMGVSINGGTPKWMVHFMENPMKMDDLGVPLFQETPISSHRFLSKSDWILISTGEPAG